MSPDQTNTVAFEKGQRGSRGEDAVFILKQLWLSHKERQTDFHTETGGSRASETRTRVKITPREKRRLPAPCHLFSRGVISRVSLTLLSLRENGGLLVV